VYAGIHLDIDGGWQGPFWWDNGAGSWWEEGPFIYNSADWTTLKITDLRKPGDQFEVYDNYILLGMTPLVAAGAGWTNVPAVAYADPTWSSGAFLLGPGDHSITIISVTTTGWNDGYGALRVDSAPGGNPVPVPAPGAALLAMIGLSLAGWLDRRRVLQAQRE